MRGRYIKASEGANEFPDFQEVGPLSGNMTLREAPWQVCVCTARVIRVRYRVSGSGVH